MSDGVSNKRRILLAAAAVAVPAGVFAFYRHLEAVGAEKNLELESSFEINAAAFRQVDAKLVGYRETSRIDVGVTSARAMAVDREGTIYVTGGTELRKLSAGGALRWRIALPERAWALAINSSGAVMVGFQGHIEIYNPDGQQVSTWHALPVGAHITSIALSGGNVYVADAGRRLVLRCDAKGNVINEIARADSSRGIPGLVVPSPNLDVAVAPDGLVWVANPGMHRLEGYSPDGQLERYWGSAGSNVAAFFGCCNPADFAILPDGSFITSEKSVARVKRFDADGRLHAVVADPNTFGESKSGMEIAVGIEGQLLVLERGTRTIRVFVEDAEKEAGNVRQAG